MANRSSSRAPNPRHPGSNQRNSNPAANHAAAVQNYGGRTDLSALDRLGMSVAMTYELNRLLASTPAATMFDPELDTDQPNAYVFDISSLARIAAVNYLASIGISDTAIGCDILTLLPAESTTVHGIDRMIELKSSGQHARTQSMTWNEWKSAANSQVCSHYYLYLVANLRSDIPEAHPFLRAVRDPFGAIRAEQQVGRRITREVVLHVDDFDEAEYPQIVVRQEDTTDYRGGDEPAGDRLSVWEPT